MSRVKLLDLTKSPIIEFIPKDHLKKILTELGYNPVSLIDGTVAGIASKKDLKHVIYNEVDSKYLIDTIRYKNKKASMELVEPKTEGDKTLKFLRINHEDPLHIAFYHKSKTKNRTMYNILGTLPFSLRTSAVVNELNIHVNRQTITKDIDTVFNDLTGRDYLLLIDFTDYKANKFIIEKVLDGTIMTEVKELL